MATDLALYSGVWITCGRAVDNWRLFVDNMVMRLGIGGIGARGPAFAHYETGGGKKPEPERSPLGLPVAC